MSDVFINFLVLKRVENKLIKHDTKNQNNINIILKLYSF